MPDFMRTILKINALAHSTSASGQQLAEALADACALPADAEVATAIMSLRDQDALKSYLSDDQRREALVRLVDRPGRSESFDRMFMTLIGEHRFDLIDIIFQAGIRRAALANEVTSLIQEIHRPGDVAWLATNFWQGTLPPRHLLKYIERCGSEFLTNAADDISSELRRRKANGGLNASLLERVCQLPSAKALAALVLAGPSTSDLDEVLRAHDSRAGLPTRADDDRLHVLDLCRSNHGRLEIMRLEPCLESVLNRPPESSFLGIPFSARKPKPL